MANGGWGVVIVIIVLAIFAGFMGSAYVESMQHEAISHAAMKNIGDQLADANVTVTAIASEKQKMHEQLVTATVVTEKMASELKEAQADKDQAEQTIKNQQATIEAMQGPGRIPPSGGYATQVGTAVSPFQATPEPQANRAQLTTMGFSITWLPAAALGFFVMVVAGAYRMLKTEAGEQGQSL